MHSHAILRPKLLLMAKNVFKHSHTNPVNEISSQHYTRPFHALLGNITPKWTQNLYFRKIQMVDCQLKSFYIIVPIPGVLLRVYFLKQNNDFRKSAFYEMNFTKWFVPFVLLLCILLDNLLNNFRSSIWTKQTLAKNIKRIIDLTQKKQKHT